MTVRWRREPGSLRVVRVDGAAPPEGVRPLVPTEPDYRRTFHEWADGIRAATGRASFRLAGGAVTPEQVRLARGVVGLSQWQLAAHLRISRGMIADAELRRRGRRIPPVLADWTRRVLVEAGAK